MNPLSARESYYRNRSIMFELVKQTKGKEIALIQKAEHPKYQQFAVRQINAMSINVLMENFVRFDFFSIPMNAYCSLASYKYIPMASFEIGQRKKDYQSWALRWRHEFLSLDYALDFDGSNLKKVWSETKKVKDFFDSLKIPYFIAFSGSKGFHIEIPASRCPKLEAHEDYVDRYFCLVYFLIKKFKLKLLDKSIIDAKRIFKIKYSWDVKSNLICLPLSDQQFESFSPGLVAPEAVLKLPNLGFRGLLLRHADSFCDFSFIR